jgi:hypothetical protein
MQEAQIMEETRKLAEAALDRPSVFFTYLYNNFQEWKAEKAQFKVNFRLTNYGAGPAVVDRVVAHPFLTSEGDKLIALVE